MTIEEMQRAAEVHTADNGLAYAVIPEHGRAADENGLARLVSAVPQAIVARAGRSACYFVPWLLKLRRTATVAVEGPAEADAKKELCHFLDVRQGGNLLLISRRFYEHDSYGLAIEFFDKIAYLAAVDSTAGGEFDTLLKKQLTAKPGELTPETWDWRQALVAEGAESDTTAHEEAWQNYRRSAEADVLGLYMTALYTDVYYEDLFEDNSAFAPLPPDQLYDRVRLAERLYPPQRGYALHIIRQRPRRRRAAS